MWGDGVIRGPVGQAMLYMDVASTQNSTSNFLKCKTALFIVMYLLCLKLNM